MATLACPHCGTFQLIPQTATREIHCVGCQKPLRTAASQSQVAGPLPPHVRSAPPVAPAAPPPVAFVVPPPPPPVAHAPRLTTQPPVPSPAKPKNGSREEEAAENLPRKSRGQWYEVLLFGGLFLGVLSGVAIVGYMLVRRPIPVPTAADKDRNVEVATESKETNPLELMWTDASQRALRKNGMKVRIEALEYFPIYGYDEQRRLIRLSDQPYLVVRLNVTNQWPKSQKYVPWYGNTFDVEGRTTGAMLWDDRGNEYAVQIFEDVPSIQGQQFERHLEKGQEVNDLIVFEVPAGVDLRELKSWRLQLPSAAVGQIGAYRFELPRTMLKTQREEMPAP